MCVQFAEALIVSWGVKHHFVFCLRSTTERRLDTNDQTINVNREFTFVRECRISLSVILCRKSAGPTFSLRLIAGVNICLNDDAVANI